MCVVVVCCCFFFQAEDGIRDLVRSRGLGDVYKRQRASFRLSILPPPRASVLTALQTELVHRLDGGVAMAGGPTPSSGVSPPAPVSYKHLTLPTSDPSVDLGGRRIINKKKNITRRGLRHI